MLGKTHVSVGIATALIITHPSTFSGIVAAAAGGGLGGWICDIDVRESSEEKGVGVGATFMIIDVAVALGIDYLLGDGICDYLARDWNYYRIIPILAFVGLCVYGFISNHRTFTHSIVALLAFSFLMKYICDPFRIPFMAGYISHIILDLFNRRGMQLLYPLKVKVAFHVCDSDGRANRIICGIGVVASLVLTVFFSFFAFQNEGRIPDLIEIGMQQSVIKHVSHFQLYLICINILSFFAYVIDYILCYNSIISEENENALHDFLNLFAYIGGALGALIALCIFARFGRDNAYWFIKIGSILAAWIVIYLLVVNPFGLITGSIRPGIVSHIPIILYLIFINILSMGLFIRDKAKRRSDINSSEAILLLVGAIGGAAGAYLVMIVTNGKRNLPHFSVGFPVMIAIHAFIIFYLLYVGMI